jgi:hypothetical protein
MTNLIVMAWILSLGFVPSSSLEISSGSIDASNCLVQNLGVGFYLANCAHIYSTVEIQETKSQGVYFDPFRSDFLIGGELYYRNFSIGVLHECNHDIVTNTSLHTYNGWEAAFNKAYINYTLPIRADSGFVLTPSITLTEQFAEKVRVKSNEEREYFGYNKANVSPNIFSPEFRLEMEYVCLRSRVAFQAGYVFDDKEWAYTQLSAGTELFYKNISVGLDYIKRVNKLKNSGYSLEGLTLFFRFRGKASLL